MKREEFDKAISKVNSGSEAHDVCLTYINALESKLEAIKSNKVAEFSGNPFGNDPFLNVTLGENELHIVDSFGKYLDTEEAYTVTISKDKQ